MGDAAEMILEGLLCEQCGVLIDGDEPGYPRLCLSCEQVNAPQKKRPPKLKIQRIEAQKIEHT